MGRYSVMRDAPGNFGTNDKIVALVDAGKNEVLKKWHIDWITSTPRTLQEPL
ncbi:unnamed protein product [Brassica oleracea var. botrytis]